MESKNVVVGVVGLGVGALGFYFYEHYRKSTKPITVGAFTNNKGYTSLMKLSPQYYNATSMEGAAHQTASSNGILTPWVLGAEQGNAMEVNAGWTSVPDSYSANVSNAWLQEEAQGARL